MAEPAQRVVPAPEPELGRRRRLAIVPAYNEEHTIERVIEEIRGFDPGFEIVVVDDGLIDRTAFVAERAGAHVLPCRSTSASAAPCRPAISSPGTTASTWRCRSTRPAQDRRARRANPGRRGRHGCWDSLRGGGGYRGTRVRRVGILRRARLAARAAAGDRHYFRLPRREPKGVRLFAIEYPPDYPEVEATAVLSRHRLRMVEVPVVMRIRETGSSSITAFRSVYYYSTVISKLSDQNRILAQRFALLEHELKNKEDD